MPEYLAPGVFVEEVSFRQKTIAGVSTRTTGFVGPCRFGPIEGEPELLTSFSEFERIYGGLDQLDFQGVTGATHNFLAHAVRAYFEEGGRRLYVSRVFGIDAANCLASWQPGALPDGWNVRARHPGEAGNFSVTFVFRLGEQVLPEESLDASDLDHSEPNLVLKGVGQFDVVFASLKDESPVQHELYWLDLQQSKYQLYRADSSPSPSESPVELRQVRAVHRLTVSVMVSGLEAFGNVEDWEDLALHPEHPKSLSKVFKAKPLAHSSELFVPLVFEASNSDGAVIAEYLMGNDNLAGSGRIIDNFYSHLLSAQAQLSEATRSFKITLENGSDGNQPTASDYAGRDGLADGLKTSLRAFEELEDISILAAPGSSFDYSQLGGSDHSAAIAQRLISHCEKMRYRLALLDSVYGHSLSRVRDYRSAFDSTRAAFYYPWIRTFDPVTGQHIDIPPSGSIAGIYARNDIERGVHNAPADEVIRMAAGLEFMLNKAQQEMLNPLGINCLRFFEGRGFRVWGARTVSSDPEWKYLNVRRYFAYLERSIERGTQWAVFENNAPVLWANIRRTIEDFLFNEWKENHLSGTKPEEAYFVRCDRSTMTQSDLDNGRLICLVGVAALRPAEFVIFRIGQQTAESSS